MLTLERERVRGRRERESRIRFLFFRGYRLLPPKGSEILSANPNSSDHDHHSMRIRGRGAAPQPSDLPPSPPPSQLHHGNHQSVQSLTRNQSSPLLDDDRRTSDLRVRIDGLLRFEGEEVGAKKDQEIGVEEEEGGSEEMGLASPSNRRGSNSSPSPETSSVMEHWREEDRVVPLKKRRATFKMETMMEIKDEKAKKRMVRVRRKRRKKWVEEDEGEENGMAKNNGERDGAEPG